MKSVGNQSSRLENRRGAGGMHCTAGNFGFQARFWLTLFAALVLCGSQSGIPGWTATARAQTTNPEAAEAPAETNAAQPAEAAAPAAPVQPIHRSSGDRVRVWGNLEVAADEAVRDAVTVFGSSKIAGEVSHDMVTVFGGADMNGHVRHDMVTVFGNAEVNGPVDHDLVVVFGTLKLGPKAKVGHDCICVFGKLEKAPGAVTHNEPIVVAPWFSGLGDWVRDGLLLGRLIPPTSGLAWIVVALHFLLYGLIALLLPRPVQSCVRQLEVRPLVSFAVGILTMVLLAPLNVILAATGAGVVLIPFIGLAELVLAILGKVATLEFFGLQLFRGFGRKDSQASLGAFLTGFILVTLVYMVPILGLVVWMALRPFALGSALMACFGGMRRNGNGHAPGVPIPPVTHPPTPAYPAGAAFVQQPSPVSPPTGPAAAETGPQPAAAPPPALGTQPGATPPLAVTVMPRAGFWIRLCATALDFVALVWILWLPHLHSFFLLFWLAYHIAMWTWRGTTIGGIVCNLKVVRTDGRDADFPVCLVRGLASVFSALPLLLGFFWVGWTADRQSWHDKIAGTVIVRVPKSMSLI